MPLGLPAAWRRGPIGGLDSTTQGINVPKKGSQHSNSEKSQSKHQNNGPQICGQAPIQKIPEEEDLGEHIFNG